VLCLTFCQPANLFCDADERFLLGDWDSCVLLRSHAQQAVNPDGTTRPRTPIPQTQHHSGLSLAALLGSGSSSNNSIVSPTGGVAAAPSTSQFDGVEPGDGCWCAPELLQHASAASAACDIFSLGASVWGVLADAVPLKDERTPGALLLCFDPHFMPHGPVSHTMQRTLRAMIAVRPADRPTAASIVALAEQQIAQRNAATTDTTTASDSHMAI